MGGSLAVAGLRGHGRRMAAAVVAVLIGVAFVTATGLVMRAVERGVADRVAADIYDRDVVLTGGATTLDSGTVDAIRAIPGTEVVGAAGTVGGHRPDGSYAVGVTMPRSADVDLLKGRLPSVVGEVALGSVMAEVAGLQVGDRFTFTTEWVEGEGTEVRSLTRSATVVGVLDLGSDPAIAGREVFVGTEAQLRQWGAGMTYQDVLVDVRDGVPDVEAALSAVREAAPAATARTGPEETAYRVQLLTAETDVLGMIVLGFGAVSLVTSAIVIANTFTIVLAQRARELALLRCLGATPTQLRRSVVTEALALGALASAAGVVLGVAGGWALTSAIDRYQLGVSVAVGPTADLDVLALPWAVGLVVTVLGAWWPTVRASRVPPLAALRPEPAGRPRAGVRVVRWAVIATLLLGGAAALVLGATGRSVPLGVLGGLLSFTGVLVAGPFLVPRAVRTIGWAARPAGVPGRLAVDNAVRNPGRAAATSAALLVGVTLITMTAVGAASAARTADQEIAAQYAVDVALVSLPDPGPVGAEGTLESVALRRSVITEVLRLPEVSAQVPLSGGMVAVRDGAGRWSATEQMFGLDPQAAQPVLRSPRDLERLVPGTVGVSGSMLASYGAAAGDRVTVSGPGGSTEATLVEFGTAWTFVLHQDVMDQVAPQAPQVGLWLRLSDDADVTAAMTGIRSAAGPQDVWIDGGAPMRDSLVGVLNLMVLLATALLGVAVLIAVVGIANTLSLSVLERGREHALLRTLGLTRGQLRATLASEGVLLAVVSTVMGVALGVLYAWCGVQALMPADITASLAMPWRQVGLVLVLAVLAGAIASVWPGRQAARVVPAVGLAHP